MLFEWSGNKKFHPADEKSAGFFVKLHKLRFGYLYRYTKIEKYVK